MFFWAQRTHFRTKIMVPADSGRFIEFRKIDIFRDFREFSKICSFTRPFRTSGEINTKLWVVKQLNQRHSSFKKQNSDSRLSRRMFDLTSCKDVGERAKLQVKLKPLVGPNGERMTRSSHRFLVTSDPNDAAVYMGDMSCHIFNCPGPSCMKGNFRDCDSIKSGFIGPWVRFEFGVDFTRGSKRSRE